MAEKTAISWTRSTFNGWRGCEKVSPACDSCYAETYDIRFFGGEHWGPDHKRALASDDYWKQPYKWNRRAPTSEFAGIKGFWPVFAIAHGDVFDKWVPPEWRARLFRVIKDTPNLTWQLVTKRIGNAVDMLPPDWGDGYPNVWVLSTVANQEEYDRDHGKLLDVRAVVRGLSIEPQLGPIDLSPKNRAVEFLSRWYGPSGFDPDGAQPARERAFWLVPNLDWIIIGGESLQRGRARDFDLAWPRSLIKQTFLAKIPIFIKQLGSRPLDGTASLLLKDRSGSELAEWPIDLRVQQWPQRA